MNFFRKIPAFILTMILIIIAVYIFFENLATRSIPSDFEKDRFQSLTDSVLVYKNQYGIPHIIAKNESDAFFAVGYCHAQDRLWQMVIQKMTGRGQLSEIFGAKTLKIDKFMRALDIRRIASESYKAMPKSTKKILESYSNGVNAYIKSNAKKLPFEFCALDFQPELWQPEDCIILQRLFALESSPGFRSDIVFAEIAERIGTQKASELIPSYPVLAPHVFDTSDANRIIKKNDKQTVTFNNSDNKNTGFSEIGMLLKNIGRYTGWQNSYGGSSIWAIKKNKQNPKSSTVLVNDLHFNISLPPKWYQLHVSASGLNVSGFTLPGIPVFWVGRNDNISWGFTNMMLDDFDYFVEKTDSSDNKFYHNSDGKKIKFRFIQDTIKVKGEQDFLYYIKKTNHSSVLSDYSANIHTDILTEVNDTTYLKKFFKKYCITFSWIGQNKSDEITALFNINKASNWTQFKHALDSWITPGLVFAYSDKSGNIGIAPAGSYPVRMKECKPNFPNPAWIAGYDWQSKASFSTLPYVTNPPRKFVFSANNKLYRASEPYLSSYWEPQSRTERIEELLIQVNDYNSRDAQIMQMDIYSNYSKQLLQQAIPILDKYNYALNDFEKKVLARIKKWDYLVASNTPSSAIINVYIERLLYHTFADELGDNLLKEYTSLNNIAMRRMLELVSDTTSSVWFDNVRSQKYEYRENIIIRSFKDASKILSEKFETEEISLWSWGKLHQLTLRHLLSND
ncbi:MAG: penicillin acylase family protein, partial [Bacteroidota bacterium]